MMIVIMIKPTLINRILKTNIITIISLIMFTLNDINIDINQLDHRHLGHIITNLLKIIIMMVITHNSVHMVEEVFVGGNIVGVVSADHVLDHICDERNLSKMMKRTKMVMMLVMMVMSITLEIM